MKTETPAKVNKTRKLTQIQINEIINKRSKDKKLYTLVQLGFEYGVDQSTISKILLGKIYKTF